MTLPEEKKIHAHPSYDDYQAKWISLYHSLNYGGGLADYFLKKSHEWCEKPFTAEDHFDTVIEVGAGTGAHLGTVKHTFGSYYLTDFSADALRQAEDLYGTTRSGGQITYQTEDATQLSFADNSADRLIATHVLEHLPKPHEVLLEWGRVVKPDGTLSIVLPTDPGFAWRFGRRLGPRKKFTQAGIAYDYWMAREHINAINNLTALINYYFTDYSDGWYPLRVPSMDMNLFYICHIKI